jgi:hypothetical protein
MEAMSSKVKVSHNGFHLPIPVLIHHIAGISVSKEFSVIDGLWVVIALWQVS